MNYMNFFIKLELSRVDHHSGQTGGLEAHLQGGGHMGKRIMRS